MQQETSQESWPVFKRLLGYVRDRKLGLVGGIIGMLGYAAVDTTFVYSIKPLIDQGLNGNDSSVLKWMPFFVLGIVALRGCAAFLSNYCMAWVGNHVVMRLQQQVFSHLMAMPMSFFDRQNTGNLLSKVTYDAGQVFAVLLPNMSESEMVDGASQLLKSLQRLHWPESVNLDTAVYLGAVCYQAEDSLLKVQEEAELALKSARLQGHSGWFLYEKSLDEEASNKGTVRWRTLINRRIEERGISFYLQPVQQERDQVVLQQELLIRIHDEQGRELQAGVFMPMAEKAGLLLPLDRLVVAQTLGLLRQRPESSCPVCLSLSAQNLLNREFQRDLFFELFQLPRSLNEGLILQLSESQVTRHYEALKRPLRALRMLGCRLAIDHAGQDVVSTQYIKEFEISFLKLHPSLVREIHLRQVNQMAVRSLVGGCANTQTRVIAVGVESGDEWKMLRHLGVHAGQGPWFAEPQRLVMPA